MEAGDLAAVLQRLDKRLDWIEESLARVEGLQYVPMGRSDHRPDETLVPAEVVELARSGKTRDAIKLYRQLTRVDYSHAEAVVGAL